ncbi:MAG: penicillin-binding protein 1A [Gammaproteobacteria bacterium]|nr:penicillin-binding protein 1A [Gammaproteobacteria bacterium]
MLKNGFLAIFSLIITGFFLLGCLIFYVYLGLPDVTTLRNMQLQVPLRVFTKDGKLIAEYGENHRIPVGLDQVPTKLIQGILATEDQRYFEHPGVDLIGLARASRELLVTGRKSQGASTITMQVARNFFLSRQKTFGRKLNEILLALKIDATLSKEKVLELYLNKIYLGQRAYGVAAAADVYFGKTLKELNLSEIALLAGLPQAPSRDNPIDNPRAALERRNHVLERMLASGYITQKEYDTSVIMPLNAQLHKKTNLIEAPYVGEMVRAAMVEAYGDAAYTNGLKVYTTIDSRLQNGANTALKNGLLSYDRRHGFRGAEKHFNKPSQWLVKLRNTPTINGMVPAVVLSDSNRYLTAMLTNRTKVAIDCGSWNKHHLKRGDFVRISHKPEGWVLAQVPKAEAAIVSLDPNNGSILALTGGFSFRQSPYNRATQAKRQPGSSFKPFIYSAALEKGFTLASIINDAPIEQYIPGSNTIWRPQNSNLKFYGPTRLRFGLVHSRNTVSIRVLQAIGVSFAINYASQFGFDPIDMPHNLTLALGTNSVTPMQLASGFATFANGGYRIKPYFIDRITDDNDKELYQADAPSLERAITSENAYLMNTVLQDVIRQGTGHRALALNRKDIAGKTGTTNDQMDGWFAGYNGDVVTTVWVGFDQQRSLSEYGADAALPIWIDFMRIALEGKPEHTLSQPPNIVRARVNAGTGYNSDDNDPNSYYELFDKAHLPAESGSEENSDHNEASAPVTEELDAPNYKSESDTESSTTLELDKPALQSEDGEQGEELF